MKKVISLFLLSIFLISNSGATISLHWCGKSLSDIHVNSLTAGECKCGKTAMKNDCCKNKTVHLKSANTLFKTNQFQLPVQNAKCIATVTVCFISQFTHQNQCNNGVVYHPPLFKPKVPVYITAGNFLI